jgi:tetratricopeptide (TPR) repeat protein
MNGRDKTYRVMFDAWSAGEYAHALEISRELLREFPDFSLGWVLQGVVLYELARYEEAEQVLHNAIQSLPLEHLHHGYVHLGHLYRERGDYTNAEKWYRKAIDIEPDHAGRYVFLGALLAKTGDISGAEASHRKATRCSKGAVDEAYFNLGLVLRAQERYREALACFEKAIELAPDYREAITAKSDVEKTISYLHVEA